MGDPKDTMTARETMAPLLEVKNLRTQFKTDDGIVKAVDDVSFPSTRRRLWGWWARAAAASQ